MPPFPKPSFTYSYQLESQLAALRSYRDTAPGRKLPTKAADRLVVMTWNVANLGVQERRPQDYRLIAEILSWSDVAAIEEVNDDLTGLRELQEELPSDYRVLFSDPAGNNERITFLYDERKVSLGEEVGEVAVPPSQLRYTSGSRAQSSASRALTEIPTSRSSPPEPSASSSSAFTSFSARIPRRT